MSNIALVIATLVILLVIALYICHKQYKENKHLCDKVLHWKTLAYTDNLTGLASRLIVGECKTQQRGRKNVMCVALIDIDYLKDVNDVYSEDTEDKILVILAETILRSVRKSDKVVRWGDDEIVIIFSGAHCKELSRIVAVIRKKFLIAVKHYPLPDGKQLDVSFNLISGAEIVNSLDEAQTQSNTSKHIEKHKRT